MEALKDQVCPVCGEKKATLREEEIDIPFFGKTFIFSITCEGCGFNKSDVEAAEEKDPVKITFETSSEKEGCCFIKCFCKNTQFENEYGIWSGF